MTLFLPHLFRRSVLLALSLCLALPLVAAGQGTLAPNPVITVLDASGDPVSSAKVYTYLAGTSTPATVYSESTLTTPHANPVVADSAGRVTIFLTPGISYKFIAKTSADVTLWTVDGVGSVPVANVDLDITGTAGASISSGSVVVLSDGSSATTAGRWYHADADAAYTSTGATAVGIAQSSASAGASLTVRLSGRVTGLSGLSAGSTYFVSATAGALTSTAPANAMRVGVAESSTVLVLNPQGASTNDRLSLTSPTIAAGALSGTFSGTPTFSGVVTLSAKPNVNAGLQFPATQAAVADANTLDDYEEGDWPSAPIIGGAGGTSGQAYSAQIGKYVKVGKWVSAWFDITLSTEGTITGNAQIQNLPFAAETGFGSCQVGYFANFAASVGFVGGLIESAGTVATLYYSAAASGSMVVVDSTIVGNTTRITGVCTYRHTQ